MHSTLRIGLDGRWTCSKFRAFLGALEDLYGVAIRIEEAIVRGHLANEDQGELQAALDGAQERLGRGIESQVPGGEYLSVEDMIYERPSLLVQGVLYGSPGHIDLLGLGSAIKQVGQFLQWLAEFYDSSARINRELKNEELQQKLSTLRIQNLKALIATAKAAGYDKDRISGLIAEVVRGSSILGKFVIEGLITDVSVIGEEHPPYLGVPQDSIPGGSTNAIEEGRE
jgi:hypothetical protein